jgi:hypothetical protein
MIDVKEEKRTLPKDPAVVSSFSRIAVKTLNPAATGTILNVCHLQNSNHHVGIEAEQEFAKDLINQ